MTKYVYTPTLKKNYYVQPGWRAERGVKSAVEDT